MKTSQVFRRGAVAVIAAGLLASAGCASSNSGTAVGAGAGGTGSGTTATPSTPTVIADPACAFGDHPQSPAATSKPLITVTTTSSWGPAFGPSPEIVMYHDGTFAAVGERKVAGSSTSSTTSAGSTGAPTPGEATVPPAQVPLLSYLGGSVDRCQLDQLLAAGQKLASLDYGETGIMDGNYTEVKILGTSVLGNEPARIGVENLDLGEDSSRLTADQHDARGQLQEWIGSLQSAQQHSASLPLDRIKVFRGRSAESGRPPATKAVEWTASTPQWDQQGNAGNCVVLTGRDAIEAVRGATVSSVLNQKQGEQPSLVYGGTFTVEGKPTVLYLVVTAPEIGCS